MRYDHHCGFISNCAGHGNLKFYFLLCFHTTVAGLYYLVISFRVLFFSAVVSGRLAWWTLLIFSVLLSIVILLPGTLTILQVHLLSSGMTENEMNKNCHDYDMGLVGNLEQVFGTKGFIYALLPIGSPRVWNGSYPRVPIPSEPAGMPFSTESYLDAAMSKYHETENIDYTQTLELNSGFK